MLSIILFLALTGLSVPFFTNTLGSIKKGILGTLTMYLVLMILVDVAVGLGNAVERSSHRVHMEAVKIDATLLMSNKKLVNKNIKQLLAIASEGRMNTKEVKDLFEGAACLINNEKFEDVNIRCALLVERPFEYHLKPLTAYQFEYHYFGKWIPQGYSYVLSKVNSIKEEWKADMAQIIWESKYTNDCYEANIQYTQSSAEGLDYVCRQKAKKAYQKHLAKKGAK